MAKEYKLEKQFIGLFVGTAVGDALGLPREGLSTKRAEKIFGKNIRHALLVLSPSKRYSTCSDDTDHMLFTAYTLNKTRTEENDVFAKELAWQMKRWFLSLPPGIGMATLKSILKLMVGVSNKKSGVFSAGNGPVMRAPIIGAYHADDFIKMMTLLSISTRMTHTDPKAYEGALAIAVAASILTKNNPDSAPTDSYFKQLLPLIKDDELKRNLILCQKGLFAQKSLTAYANALSLTKKGVTGYVNHTVPIVIYAWLAYFNDYEKTITSLIQLGGDSDTTAAIAGALAGLTVGVKGIPREWRKGIVNDPASLKQLRRYAIKIARKSNNKVKMPSYLVSLLKNILSFPIILGHGFRRLFPPY